MKDNGLIKDGIYFSFRVKYALIIQPFEIDTDSAMCVILRLSQLGTEV